MDNCSVMIGGVGGQGTVLAGKILGLAAMKAGLEVKQSEIHGMSQRGGSVLTHIRFGGKVYSPLVTRASADYIIAFEELEALRCLPYLKKEGLFIVNRQQTLPMPVITGAASYPAAPVKEMEDMGVRVIGVDASGIGQEQGDARTANVVLLGVLAGALSFPADVWRDAIRESMKPKLLEMNLAAFAAGQKIR